MYAIIAAVDVEWSGLKHFDLWTLLRDGSDSHNRKTDRVQIETFRSLDPPVGWFGYSGRMRNNVTTYDEKHRKEYALGPASQHATTNKCACPSYRSAADSFVF